MSTSQEVFALRKSGMLDEAYAMALEVIQLDPHDEWSIKALAWCLYDLTKRSVSQSNYELAKSYIEQLEALQINESDEILLKSIEQAKILASPEKKIILQAKEQSKLGNHLEALTLFKQALQKFPDDVDLNTQFAWELHKEGKIIFDTDKVDVQKARKLLADYIKLKNERPSQLHSLFLRFADKITDREEFNLISFLKLWNLDNLREDDFEPFSKDGKTYPSIAEKIIQHGAKLILDKKLTQEVDFFLHFLNTGIKRFQDNIWLSYYKAKLLHIVNRKEEAIEFLMPVVKEKISDYWTWSLLAELVLETDKEKAISCYCKSLLCKGEDKFLANVRIKFAELLIQNGLSAEAKFEIATAIKIKEAEETKISDKLKDYQQADWYKNATEKKNNNDFYISHKQLAEEFIFHSLPWLDSCLGETFTIPEKPGKPRRKVFINLDKEIIEVAVSDKKFNTSRNFKIGEAIRIKGEYDKEKKFQIYLLEKRNSQESWDLFEWHKGNIVQEIQNEGGQIRALRVSFVNENEIKEGIFDIIVSPLKFSISEGIPIFVKYYQKSKPRSIYLFRTEKEQRVHVLSISERTDGKIWDSFPEQLGIVDHINIEKGIAHFLVSKEVDSIVKLNQVSDKVEIGSRLLVKLKKITKDKESYYTILTCKITQQDPPENLIKSFNGMINKSGNVGFANDVYIDSSLMQEHMIEDDNIVSGTAILNYNKKKRTWGWKAIKILTNIADGENTSNEAPAES